MILRSGLLLLLLLKSFSILADENCTAQFDEMNIGHQEVSSLDEFYYCFGVHHARDRAWEMDYFRRIGQGRNSEVLGFDHLKSDLMMRLLDLPTLAGKLTKNLNPDKLKFLKEYSRGVNEGFKVGRKSKEFQDLNYGPEEWKPEHTILILLLQSFDQTKKTFMRDIEEEKAREAWGNSSDQLFNEDGLPWQNTILKEGEYPKKDKSITSLLPEISKELKLWSSFPSVFGEESGSNNWVISKKKSKTGHAILANDPHLDLKTPMFWYWIHLKSPQLNVIGSSVPGVPLIISGTNGKVSWGLTNAYINTADAVYLKTDTANELESIRPWIKIKWGFLTLPFFFKKFEKTKSGIPILPLELKSDKKVALIWTGFHLESEDVESMFDLIDSQNIDDMDSALKKVGLPSWNYVFADTKGEIGYRLTGKVLKLTEKNAFGISEKTLNEIEHPVFFETDERPHLIRPSRDYIYTSNNRHWPEDAKFYGGRGYSYSFRGFRIDELLKGQQDVASFKAIQCDRQAVDARFFVKKLLKLIESPVLEKWNFSTNETNEATGLYRRFMDLLMEKWKVNEYALFRLLDSLEIKQQLEMKEIYKQALMETKDQTWGSFHRINFPHLSKNRNWVFSPELAGVGDNHSVDPGTSKWNQELKKYEQYSGSSMRMIIEMSKTPKIILTLPGLNRNYASDTKLVPWQRWKECIYEDVQY